jgi:hypothetical protein
MAYLYFSPPIAVVWVIFRVYCTTIPPASRGKRAVGSVGFYLTPVILLVLRWAGVVSSPFLNL